MFESKLKEGFVPERLVAVTSLFGSRKVSFFALGKSSLPQFKDKYVDDSLLPERPVPRKPGERKPGEGFDTELTLPDPVRR